MKPFSLSRVKRVGLVLVVLNLAAPGRWAYGQGTPSGEARDFRVKPCLHSIGYAGLWRGQAQLGVDEFLVKAKELGIDSVMIMAKRPHLSPLDYDAAARA